MKHRKPVKKACKPKKKLTSTRKAQTALIEDFAQQPKAESTPKRLAANDDQIFPNLNNFIHRRDNQLKNILSFLKNRLEQETGGVLFFSGPPGSGKTYVAQRLLECAKQAPTKTIKISSYINCLTNLSVENLMYRVCKELRLKSFSTEGLKERFKGKYFGMLVVDEADRFHTSYDLEQLTQILEIAMDSTSTLIIIVITNAVDLYRRMLSNISRECKQFCVLIPFIPYNRDDLFELLRIRTTELTDGDDTTFDRNALYWCANRFSTLSGDFRDAFHACELAIETARKTNRNLVRITDVSRITLSAVSSTMKSIHLYKLPLQQRLIISVVAFFREKNIQFNIYKVYLNVNKLSAAINESPLSEDDLWYAIDALVDNAIVEIKGRRNIQGSLALSLSRSEYMRKMEANPFMKFLYMTLSDMKI